MIRRFRRNALVIPFAINCLKSYQIEMPIVFPCDSTLRHLTEARKLERFANVNMQAQGE